MPWILYLSSSMFTNNLAWQILLTGISSLVKGMRFSDEEPKMVEVDGMLISEVVLNERNKNLK